MQHTNRVNRTGIIHNANVTTLNVAVLGNLQPTDAVAGASTGEWTLAWELARINDGSKFARHEHDGWLGGLRSRADADALYRDGWAEGAAKASALRAGVTNLIPASTIPKRVRRTGDDGDELRLDAVLAGDWDNAYTQRQLVRQGGATVVSLATGWIASAMVDHDDLIWNAVQMSVLCDALEDAGYSVELRAVDVVKSTDGTRQFIDITIKRAEEPLRADLVAATIGHAGVYRTLGHAAFGLAPLRNGYAYPICTPEEVPPLVRRACEDGIMASVSAYIPRADCERVACTNIKNALTTLFPNGAN